MQILHRGCGERKKKTNFLALSQVCWMSALYRLYFLLESRNTHVTTQMWLQFPSFEMRRPVMEPRIMDSYHFQALSPQKNPHKKIRLVFRSGSRGRTKRAAQHSECKFESAHLRNSSTERDAEKQQRKSEQHIAFKHANDDNERNTRRPHMPLVSYFSITRGLRSRLHCLSV